MWYYDLPTAIFIAIMMWFSGYAIGYHFGKKTQIKE